MFRPACSGVEGEEGSLPCSRRHGFLKIICNQLISNELKLIGNLKQNIF